NPIIKALPNLVYTPRVLAEGSGILLKRDLQAGDALGEGAAVVAGGVLGGRDERGASGTFGRLVLAAAGQLYISVEALLDLSRGVVGSVLLRLSVHVAVLDEHGDGVEENTL
ncbi:hypothetical protein RZS08_19470, partial [Arthrospira platensis SPKY1]|nr:hypothetical protein [Arthrospira platensis SPKY1]